MNRLLIIKKVQIGCLAFVLLALFMGCSENKNRLMDTTWRVVSIKTSENSDYLYPEDFLYAEEVLCLDIRKIRKDETFTFHSVRCFIGGKLKIRNNKIDFKDTSLSLDKYCDPFMEDIANLLINKINYYETDGRTLILTGKNGVEFNCVIYIQ